MQRIFLSFGKLATVAGMMLALAACSDFRDSLGLSQKSPDEFSVTEGAPLSVPPDFALRPPEAGAPARAQQTPADERAAETLFGTEGMRSMPKFGGGGRTSPGEQALLTEIKATPANSDIRDQIDRESGSQIVSSPAFIQKLLFWRKDEVDANGGATVVNAVAEKNRIDADKAAGKPVTQGGTPVITQGKSSTLGDWF